MDERRESGINRPPSDCFLRFFGNTTVLAKLETKLDRRNREERRT